MDKRLKSTRSCLFSLIVMVAVTSSVPAESSKYTYIQNYRGD